MILETKRLVLREMNESDYPALCRILQDEEVMYAYEHAFSDEEVSNWLANQLRRYREDGFGLWAVILKSTGQMIGQCGITKQETNGRVLPEIGYLFEKAYWHQGYAIEAASGCRHYAFHTLGFDSICSIIRENNFASRKVAEKNGMTVQERMVKHYYGIEMPHLVYMAFRSDGEQAGENI